MHRLAIVALLACIGCARQPAVDSESTCEVTDERILTDFNAEVPRFDVNIEDVLKHVRGVWEGELSYHSGGATRFAFYLREIGPARYVQREPRMSKRNAPGASACLPFVEVPVELQMRVRRYFDERIEAKLHVWPDGRSNFVISLTPEEINGPAAPENFETQLMTDVRLMIEGGFRNRELTGSLRWVGRLNPGATGGMDQASRTDPVGGFELSRVEDG